MGTLSTSLTAFITGDSLAQPPPAALATAVDGFTDCLAVMIAGAREPVCTNLLTTVTRYPSQTGARLLLTDSYASVADCALVGTAAAHALDFDDYAYSNHVSALLVPAIVADGGRLGSSGSELLAAYLAGFEVWGTVFKREPDHLHSKGWHPTGVFGPIGVAAALCRLRGLDALTTQHALGLAAASGGGVMDNFGSQAKPWQGARAAQAGVLAVDWAVAGLDAGEDALDGSGGLMAALSPGGKVDRQSSASDLGSYWMAASQSLNIKRHPMVGASQRAIDAAIQLHDDLNINTDEIRRITVRVSEKHAAVMRLHRPENASQARFSVEFGVAAGLLCGQVGLQQLRDEFVQSAPVQALLRRVDIEVGPDDDPSYPVGARYDTVTVTLEDGEEITSEKVYRFLGHGENPMSEAQLREKFDDCSRDFLSPDTANELFLAIRNLDKLPNTRELPTLSLID